MKYLLLCGIAASLFMGTITDAGGGQVSDPPASGSSGKESCNFSKYKRLGEPHRLYSAAVKKVDPDYPQLGKSARASGKVVVRILVNKRGDVAAACVVEGHPLLRAAALKAAKQWKFKKNFGFNDYKPVERFAETEIISNFSLPEQRNDKTANFNWLANSEGGTIEILAKSSKANQR
ncbi:MAG: TonB family protein [Pyrinomonadaceae bacterium]